MNISVGDINFDLSDTDEIEVYKNLMNEHGFFSYINKVTRKQNEKKKTRLNHSFFNKILLIIIQLQLILKLEIKINQIKINFDTLRTCLQRDSWDMINSCYDVHIINEEVIKKLT